MDSETQATAAAFKAYVAAEDTWSAELRATFGKRTGDVRYTKAGEGEPGTPLRSAYDNYVATGDAWRKLAYPAAREQRIYRAHQPTENSTNGQ